MTFEQLLIPVLMAVGGWFARHYGLLAPTDATPQTAPGTAGTSPVGPVSANTKALLQELISVEVQKGVAYLEGKLLPHQVAGGSPQT